MADLCLECERLWKEYAAALHEYLGLNAMLPSRDFVRRQGSPIDPQSLAALKDKILRHEGRHSDAS